MTNLELKTKTFVINYNLKSTIEEFYRNQNDTESKLIFRSFNIHRGRSYNDDWKNYPKLHIIISLLGPSGVGKSCLSTNVEYGQPLLNHISQITMAMDMHFFYLDRLFEDKYVVIVQINDCPGNDRFEAVSDRHFRNCHGAVLMVDTTDIQTFERLQDYWYKRLCQKSSFDKVEAVLACNKIDLLEKNYDSSYRKQFFKRADTFASQYQMPVFNISALRGDNVQTMFHHLILNILQNQSLVKILKEIPMKTEEETSAQTSMIKVTEPPKLSKKDGKSSCC
jgi:Ras-related protein Rab-1A